MKKYKEIQGWISQGDLQWLYETAQKMNSIVEIGCWKGKSTYSLLYGCKGKVYAIDTFLGTPGDVEQKVFTDKEDILSIFMENVGHFRNLDIMKGNSHSLVITFPDKSLDMVFIDADHNYEMVKRDIELWLPKTKKLISGHDIQYSPTENAVRDALGEYQTTDDNIWYKELS